MVEHDAEMKCGGGISASNYQQVSSVQTPGRAMNCWQISKD